MRVVVLGGGGFIGSHLAARLAQYGHEVLAVDINFPIHRQPWWAKVETLQCDLRNELPPSLFLGADHVFHLAADMGGVGYFHSRADPKASADNMRIDLNVVEAINVANVPLFYASSACALPVSDRPLTESLLGQGPADQMYGEQKRFMAMLLGKYQHARVGIFHTIYGPGRETDGQRSKFPPAICRKVREGGTIEIWGDGTQMRTFLYIDDAVDKILVVAGLEHYQNRYEGPVNIGSDEEVTVRQCADWLCQHAGVEANYRFRLDKPTGVLARGCDNTEYDRRYGRLDPIPARKGLIWLYEWLGEHETHLSAAA